VEMVILHRHVGESGLQGQLSQLLEGHPLQIPPDANVNRVSVEMPGVLRGPNRSVLVVASVSARYNARLIPGQLAEALQHLNELRSNLNRLAMWALELIKLEVLRELQVIGYSVLHQSAPSHSNSSSDTSANACGPRCISCARCSTVCRASSSSFSRRYRLASVFAVTPGSSVTTRREAAALPASWRGMVILPMPTPAATRRPPTRAARSVSNMLPLLPGKRNQDAQKHTHES